ncbi:16S rRNA (cytidine(1402)-2'-O)-methyltransferase [Persephonella sp.]|nr:16S rRNA (cytidine(1402)-2'-O)-methyltransferase [Aquificota bacterium]
MGTLYVVATPIGNLKDITFRAVEVLENVDIIACEDTRVTKKLLNHYGISGKKLISYHEHNEEKAAEKLVALLKEGSDVALVSDAGTPCISDPGYRLVKKAWESGIVVVPIPGPFAGVTALSASGLPTDRFLFTGFLPQKEKHRKEALEEYIQSGYTFVLYESPRRVLKTLELIHRLAPDSDVVVAKELTKIHERFFRGKPQELIKVFSDDSSLLKGEFVIIVHPVIEEESDEDTIVEEIKRLLDENKKTGEIAKTISRMFNIPKSHAYKMVLKVQKE